MLKNFKIEQMPKNFKIEQIPKNFKIENVLNFNGFGFFKKATKSSNDSQTSPTNYINEIETNPANYIKVFANTTPVEFVSDAVEQKDLVIATAYKQVFGNAHLMESERVVEAESQLRSDQITVMEFIRQLAKSERYRVLVFEKNSNLRAIELNFKHLLGRAPENYAEISEHIARLANEGFDAEIDSYINSDEYFKFFGTDIVPYYRGYQTQTGRNLVGYTHSFQLARGASSSDKSTPVSCYLKLDTSLLNSASNAITVLLDNMNISEIIQKFSQSPRAPQPLVSKYSPRSTSPSANIYAPEEIIRRALKLNDSAAEPQIYKNGTKSYNRPPIPDPTDPKEIIRKALKLNNSTPQPQIYKNDTKSYNGPPIADPNDPNEIIRRTLKLNDSPTEPQTYDAPPISDPTEIIRKALKLSNTEKS